jgi:hypothetical protein
MDAGDMWVVTTAIAIYGAVLATYGAALATYTALMKRRETLADVRVTLSLTLAVVPGDGTMTRHLGIFVENHGSREVTFGALSSAIEVKRVEDRFVIGKATNHVESPKTLTHGTSFELLSPLIPLKEELAKRNLPAPIKMRAVVHDQLNRRYRSKWQTLSSFDAKG